MKAWECVAPGEWRNEQYMARRMSGHSAWELRRSGEALYTSLTSLEDCKRAAQQHEDRANYKAPETFPVSTVTRVEVIDHRPCAAFRGRAFSARGVARTELSFQDNAETLKVFLT